MDEYERNEFLNMKTIGRYKASHVRDVCYLTRSLLIYFLLTLLLFHFILPITLQARTTIIALTGLIATANAAADFFPYL